MAAWKVKRFHVTYREDWPLEHDHGKTTTIAFLAPLLGRRNGLLWHAARAGSNASREKN